MHFSTLRYTFVFSLILLFGFGFQEVKAQPFVDGCFASPAVGTSFASTTSVTNRDSDLLRWTGAAWTGGWPGANITLAPPGAVVNTRAIWSGDGTVWTTGGEGFGLRLLTPIVTGTTYTFAFRRVSHGTGQNGNFAPILYTNTGGTFGTSYGAIPGVGTAWTNSNITFTAAGGSSGHTFVYFHNSVGSGMFLGCNTPILPMAFSGLQAFPSAERIHLEWYVQDEANYQWHVVERSLNGIDFAEVGRQASMRAGSDGHLYSHADEVQDLPDHHQLYYRIRSIDQDGLEALSPVVETAVANAQSFQAVIAPSPTTHGELAFAHFHADEAGLAKFTVQDLSGRLVSQGEWPCLPGRNTMPLQGANLAQGAYILRIQLGAKAATCRWNVQ
jgi:hypothetical protein